ncbi:zinc ribbon domain-containing protein [Priestia megaterium]|uniref:zinc ribbon domain-containing protein n=1 Tax=Priestia megaterium TaxID=1404 RepID=UPI00345838D8
MSFCNECGNRLKEGAEFCNECGRSVEKSSSHGPKESTFAENNANTRIKNQSTEPPHKMSKKTKGKLIAVGIGAVLLFSGYKAGEHFTNKDRLIDRFETAVHNNDQETVAHLLSSSDSKLEINKENVKGFMTYFQKHPDEVNDMVDVLKLESQALDKGVNLDKELSSTYEYDPEVLPFQLAQRGKTAFLFDKYTIEVKPMYLQIETEYKDTGIYVDGKKVGTASSNHFSKTYGPYVPGMHKVEGKYKTGFVDLVTKDTVSFMDSVNKKTVSLDLKGEDITFDLGENPPDMKGKLLIEGKKVKVNPFKTSEFGPVVTDGSMSMKVTADFPWGEMTSKNIPIDSSEIHYNFGRDNDLENTLMDIAAAENKNLFKVYSTGKPNALENVTNHYKRAVTESIGDGMDTEYSRVKYVGSTFDLNTGELNYTDEGIWEATIIGKELYGIDYGTGFEKEEKVLKYSLVYDEKKKEWLVDNVEDAYGPLSKNVKEVKEEHPTVYQMKTAKSGENGNDESKIIEDDTAAENTDEDVRTDTEDTAEAEDEDVSDTADLTRFMTEYMDATMESIKSHDFSIAAPYIDPAGKKYSEQKEYTAYLNQKNITEDLLNFEVTKVEPIPNGYQVNTSEEYNITYGDGSVKHKKFKSVHKIQQQANGSLGVNELISSTEVN